MYWSFDGSIKKDLKWLLSFCSISLLLKFNSIFPVISYKFCFLKLQILVVILLMPLKIMVIVVDNVWYTLHTGTVKHFVICVQPSRSLDVSITAREFCKVLLLGIPKTLYIFLCLLDQTFKAITRSYITNGLLECHLLMPKLFSFSF